MLHNARRSSTCDTIVWNISSHHASGTLIVSIEFLKIFFYNCAVLTDLYACPFC